MTKSIRDTSTQLRGPGVIKAIRSGIKSLWQEAEQRGESYVYNASELSRRIGITRKTIRKYEKVVTAELDEIEAERRTSTGSKTIIECKTTIARLRKELESRETDIDGLRRAFIALADEIQAESVDIGALLRATRKGCDVANGRCPVCGTKNADSGAGLSQNVVSIHRS